MLVIPADYLDFEAIKEIILTWVSTPFSNDRRHINRLEKLERQSYDDIAAGGILELFMGESANQDWGTDK